MKKIFLIVFGLIFLTLSCNTGKKPITPEKFKSVMEENGYVTKDVTAQYGTTLVVQAMIAMKDGYQIEFFETQNEEIAAGSYNTNKETFEKSKENGYIL